MFCSSVIVADNILYAVTKVYAAGTWRNNNVIITSKRRRDVGLT